MAANDTSLEESIEFFGHLDGRLTDDHSKAFGTLGCKRFPTIDGAVYHNKKFYIFVEEYVIQVEDEFHRNGLPMVNWVTLRTNIFPQTSRRITGSFSRDDRLYLLTTRPGVLVDDSPFIQRYVYVDNMFKLDQQAFPRELFGYSPFSAPLKYGAAADFAAPSGAKTVTFVVYRAPSGRDPTGPLPTAAANLGSGIFVAFGALWTRNAIYGAFGQPFSFPEVASVHPYQWSGHLLACPQNFCYDTKIDAADSSGSRLSFYRGLWSFEITTWPPTGPPGNPVRSSFPGVTGFVDAVASSDETTVIFHNQHMRILSPEFKYVSDRSVHSNLVDVSDAIFNPDDSTELLVFNDKDVHSYKLNTSSPIGLTYQWSRQIILLKNLPQDVDAVVQTPGGVYFFKNHWHYRLPPEVGFNGLEAYEATQLNVHLTPWLFRCVDEEYDNIPALVDVLNAKNFSQIFENYWKLHMPPILTEKDFAPTVRPTLATEAPSSGASSQPTSTRGTTPKPRVTTPWASDPISEAPADPLTLEPQKSEPTRGYPLYLIIAAIAAILFLALLILFLYSRRRKKVKSLKKPDRRYLDPEKTEDSVKMLTMNEKSMSTKPFMVRDGQAKSKSSGQGSPKKQPKVFGNFDDQNDKSVKNITKVQAKK
ncbi:hypothetical protein HDE_09461 [Halotydeus destructor]|nr:hypothetical protein HDE_09461 [Halotydeus destructor]